MILNYTDSVACDRIVRTHKGEKKSTIITIFSTGKSVFLFDCNPTIIAVETGSRVQNSFSLYEIALLSADNSVSVIKPELCRGGDERP